MSGIKTIKWGAATSAYQIEGGHAVDGKGPSIWDQYCEGEGNIENGDRGEVTCDHYHRWEEDVTLMREIGLERYRLSISWPRVLPEGTGRVNEEGLGFYDRLIDGLLGAGIEPLVTLFHWDYPQLLEDRGGWSNQDSVNWYADYVRTVADRLGDRVTDWITFNEPQVFMHEGHFTGTHAPGSNLSQKELLQACHNVLLGHGHGCRVIREVSKVHPRIGWAPAGRTWLPASDKPEDIEAARSLTLGVHEPGVFSDAWWSDPVVLGKYPDEGLAYYGDAVPEFTVDEMKQICQPLDFYCINLYFGVQRVKAGPDGPEKVPWAPGRTRTLMDWPITPEVLYWSPKWLFERYKLPMVISECGVSCLDYVSPDGRVRDPMRKEFLHNYLSELKRAIDEGVDVRAFFHWSLMDNFEWSQGFRQRFGLIHVDYETGKRTLKESAYWYSDLIASRGAMLDSTL
jgi:beta-glucosidase